MPTPRTTRIRPAKPVLAFAAAVLLASCRIASASVASATSDCDASGSSFKCEAQGFLHFLYAAAGVLAIVLAVVLAAAIHIYRKNKNATKVDE